MPVKSLRRLAAVLSLVFLGGVVLFAANFLRQVHNMGGKRGALSVIESVRNPRGQFPNEDRVNILLFGKDYEYVEDKNDPTRNMQRHTKTSRSDTIAVISLDLDKKTVSMLSIPRDTRVEAPVKWGSAERTVGKINAVYRRGGEKLLRQTVSELLGVTPDYYVAVKIDALKNMVDALGGVEVETIDVMKYHDNKAGLHIDLPKGRFSINGTQAIGFARFREADIYERNPDGTPIFTGRYDSDGNPIFKRKRHIEHSREETEPRRIARQQQLIRAMVDKAKSFENLFQLDHLVNVGLEQIDTDMDRMQIFALAALFRTAQTDQIQSDMLHGETRKVNGLFFFYPEERKTQALVSWLLKGNERAACELTAVRVLNGTNTPGLAGRVSELLREQGFRVQGTANAPRTENGSEVEETRIVYGKAAVALRAKKIASLIGGGTLKKEAKPDTSGLEGFEDEETDVTIIIGRDLVAALSQRSAKR